MKPKRFCPYCQSKCKVQDSSVIYGRSYGPVLICTRFPACDSYVGCHRNGRPLGTLANAELRRFRNAAHAAFDPIWKTGRMRRQEAYAWLAKRLGIDKYECHIAMFDLDMCGKVIEICREEKPVGSAA